MKTIILDLKKNLVQSETYQKVFQVDSKWTVRVKSSVAHALTEVTKGLLRVYPHKLQVGLLTGQSPYVYTFTESVARDGVKVLDFSGKDSLEEIISVVSDETCFVVLSDDNPITGEIYSIEPLIKKLTDKKIFTVVIRHNSHTLHPQCFSPNPYLIEIREHQSYATLLLGPRSKKIDDLFIAPVTADYIFEYFKTNEDRSSIEAFEKSVTANSGVSCYFSNTQKRIWDRSVICLEENSEPMYQELKKILINGTIICTSKCTYDHPFNYAWWFDDKFTAETMNQWIILDVAAIKEIGNRFSQMLADTYNKYSIK